MLEPGEVFAGYTIERRLGAGGMGEVYVARHPRLPRREALKVLAPNLADDAQFRARFEREADLAASLSHQNIVAVHDRGETDGRLWIALDLVDGVDLGEVVRRGPMPVGEVARVVGDVASALDFAGAQGLIHRDVKPANIMVSTTGRVLLTDFGIARLGAENSELTGTGMTLGTISYASPEQLQGQPVDARSDQYSLAATAFHLLTGSVPFTNTNAGAVIVAHVTAPVPSVRVARPELSARVDAVIARGMAKSSADRYPSSEAFAAELAAALVEAAGSVAPIDPTMIAPDRTVIRPVLHSDDPSTGRPPNKSRSKATSTRIVGAIAAISGLAVVAGTFGPWVVTTFNREGSVYTDRTPGLGKTYSDVVQPGGAWKLLSNGDWYLGITDMGIAAVVVGSLIALVGVALAVTARRVVAVVGAVLGAVGVAGGLYVMVNPDVVDQSSSWLGSTTSTGWGLWMVMVGAVAALAACATEVVASAVDQGIEAARPRVQTRMNG
ncbi:serine/threonine-protein kinase [Tsukamurella pseudospumae]|uniref:non-specific serine/threonine protein kinase n=1 Tax=Tsukamurella pseudospumae TaxID=239498 RepID=A0A137ZYU4_9ACTN|nr:serine/threonine-protein kinase [Tsukamurella pseudospumae]KXO99555.1 hypothetical protein AXK61_17160 [Tsukamurella pseudospumae]KXP03309.1 hypothetical protein AXK60_15840 [Tsukamurella pseudospumae]